MAPHHELRQRVRYSETDQMGVVHHAAYVIWLEEGRTALMREVGIPYEELERAGFAVAVRRLDLRYRAAARYGDEVLVRTTIGGLRGASIRFNYEVLRCAGDQALLLTGTVETVSLDLASLRPIPLPEALRSAVDPLGRRQAARLRSDDPEDRSPP